MKKRIALIGMAVVFAACILVGGTFAWFTDRQEVTNVVTMGNVSVVLNDIYEGHTVALPSKTVSKIVSVTNDGEQPAYVRIQLKKYWSAYAEDGKQPDGTENPELIHINFTNPEDWVLGNDGAYYYQKPLEPDVTTSNLFESFTLDEKIDNRYDQLQGNIEVSAQAVQSKNFEKQLDKNGEGQIVGWGDVQVEDNNISPFKG